MSRKTETLPRRFRERPLDRSRGPAHAQIAEQLAQAIAGGELVPGDRLPAEPALADRFGVSRMTLRQAIAALEQRGLVIRAVGRTGGTFVAKPKLERDLTTFAGLSEQLRRQGVAAGARLLAAAEVDASPDAVSALELEPGARVYEIARVRLADGEPVALERTAFPAAFFPGLLGHRLDGSLYDLLHRRYGRVPRRAVERLEPTLAARAEAEALEVETGAPLMLVERVAYADSVPLEFSRELHRGDRTRAVVWTSELAAPT